MKLLSFTCCRFKTVAVVLGMLCLSQHGMAATIFTWGGDYVSAYQGIVGEATTSDGVSTWLYSEAIAKSPSASVYSGPKFNGAFSLINGDGVGTPVFRDSLFGIADSSAGDQIRFSASAPVGSTVRMRGLVSFEQESFLGNASTGTVTFDSKSSMSLQMSTSVGASGNRSIRMAVHALVGDKWGWYLSSSAGAGQTAPFTIDAPATSNWELYTIDGSSSPISAAPTSYTTPGSAFTDIDQVGFFFDFLSTTSTLEKPVWASMYLSSFEFNGNVAAIPEPSSAMLWLGGAVLVVSFRKLAARR